MCCIGQMGRQSVRIQKQNFDALFAMEITLPGNT
jgi:hypothetical protein